MHKLGKVNQPYLRNYNYREYEVGRSVFAGRAPVHVAADGTGINVVFVKSWGHKANPNLDVYHAETLGL